MDKNIWRQAFVSWGLFLGVIGIIATIGGGCYALSQHHPWGWLLIGVGVCLLYLGFVLGEWMTRG